MNKKASGRVASRVGTCEPLAAFKDGWSGSISNRRPSARLCGAAWRGRSRNAETPTHMFPPRPSRTIDPARDKERQRATIWGLEVKGIGGKPLNVDTVEPLMADDRAEGGGKRAVRIDADQDPQNSNHRRQRLKNCEMKRSIP